MWSYQSPVQSRPTVDFLEALLTNESSAVVNLPLPTRDAKWYVRAITIVSVQNLAWELWAFSRASNLGGTFPTDNFIAMHQFPVLVVGPPASAGWPVSVEGASPADPYYRQYVDGLAWPCYDLDQMEANAGADGPSLAHLHVRLVNRSTDAKLAGASGAVQVTFHVEPQGGQPA